MLKAAAVCMVATAFAPFAHSQTITTSSITSTGVEDRSRRVSRMAGVMEMHRAGGVLYLPPVDFLKVGSLSLREGISQDDPRQISCVWYADSDEYSPLIIFDEMTYQTCNSMGDPWGPQDLSCTTWTGYSVAISGVVFGEDGWCFT